MGCPFCAPAVADITFMESGRFRAIVNVAPILPGHSLIIPKRHVESLLELSDDEAAEMVKLSRRAVALLMRFYGSDGFDWTIQESEAAGQSVPHLHLHLIPRTRGDVPDPGDWYTRLIEFRERPRLTHDEMRRIAEQLRTDAAESDPLGLVQTLNRDPATASGAGDATPQLPAGQAGAKT